MLDYNILKKKPILKTDTDEFVDLTKQTYNPKRSVHGEILVVNQYYVARPDLISLAMYGDDKYADIICKFNGISNPFELNENDVIYIPNPEELTEVLEKSVAPSELISNSKTPL